MAKKDTPEMEKHGHGVFSLLCYLNAKNIQSQVTAPLHRTIGIQDQLL